MAHPKKSGESPKDHILYNELVDCFGSLANVNAKTLFSGRRKGLFGAIDKADKEANDDSTDCQTDADKAESKSEGTNETKRNRNKGSLQLIIIY